MKRKSPEEQIAFVLKQAEHGTPELEAIRKMGDYRAGRFTNGKRNMAAWKPTNRGN